MAGLGIREALMLIYAAVWAVLLTLYSIRSAEWPPPEMWAALAVGEGALMTLFAANEAAGRRRNGDRDSGHVNGRQR
jgi:hypothetical protein